MIQIKHLDHVNVLWMNVVTKVLTERLPKSAKVRDIL